MRMTNTWSGKVIAAACTGTGLVIYDGSATLDKEQRQFFREASKRHYCGLFMMAFT